MDKKLFIYLIIAIVTVLVFLYITKKQKFGSNQVEQQSFTPDQNFKLEPYGDDEYSSHFETRAEA